MVDDSRAELLEQGQDLGAHARPQEPRIDVARVGRVGDPVSGKVCKDGVAPGTDERPDEGVPLRTDTMILLSLDPSGQTLGMLSLPRDLWVPIPGKNTTAKINTAYTIGSQTNYPGGGPQLAKDTVSSFIGRPVDYYVRVNFDGFREIVDLIGGVDINVPYTIHDEEYPTENYGVETFHLDAGLQHLDGAADLLVTADHRVELSGACHLGEIAPVLLERAVGAFGVLRADALPAPDDHERF